MEPDQFQRAWRAEASQTRVIVDAEVLKKEVQLRQQGFRSLIFWRDLREVGVSLLLVPLWIFLGRFTASPWTWYLTIPALLWVAGFLLVHRRVHRQTPSAPGEPLVDCVKKSLAEVEDQIWLLRNVFWWYLLPLLASNLAFIAQVTWNTATGGSGWWAFLVGALFSGMFFLVGAGFFAAVYGFVYYVNQRAADLQLEPMRRDLLALLGSLREEDGSGGPVALSGLPFSETSLASSPPPPRKILMAVGGLIVAVVILAVLTFDPRFDQAARSSGPSGEKLAKLVTDLRRERNLVGLAAMVTVDGKVEGAAAYGPRKIGTRVSLEIGDQWHIGGITKSITATMIARLAESGKMKWSDTVGEIFSEGGVHEDWKPVTLRQLLTDTAGAPANFPSKLWFHRPSPGAERMTARRDEVLSVLGTPPAFPPGQKNAYSNVGITMAAAMAEKVTGTSWEDLVQREVFEPLKLTGAGFGPPLSSDTFLEQPRGHLSRLTGKVALGDDADNSSIMGPSGSVHMTLNDLCIYANDQLRGELGEGQLLSAESYKLLHRPELNQYACGWIVDEPGRRIPSWTYWHNGSNTLWYAMVAFIPETKMVVAVTANDGDSANAEEAAWKILDESVKRLKEIDN